DLVANFQRKFVYTHCNEYRANSKSYLFEFAKADKIGLSKRYPAFRYSIGIIKKSEVKSTSLYAT
ncbi:MAG: hypothetical protein U0K87_00225, partial [Ruminococcus sp.]|nr:hypothetical protein [Ruminococcus sp.]